MGLFDRVETATEDGGRSAENTIEESIGRSRIAEAEADGGDIDVSFAGGGGCCSSTASSSGGY
jgi:hypothetical protein